ncbi:hypothetical protein, partial [Arthrobacter sp. MYb222]|uniref:hypothetical protein n=1 Tax=Arthrobacter sp. MYb222 TaxID=1848599 RepID=UPI001C61163F
ACMVLLAGSLCSFNVCASLKIPQKGCAFVESSSPGKQGKNREYLLPRHCWAIELQVESGRSRNFHDPWHNLVM